MAASDQPRPEPLQPAPLQPGADNAGGEQAGSDTPPPGGPGPKPPLRRSILGGLAGFAGGAVAGALAMAALFWGDAGDRSWVSAWDILFLPLVVIPVVLVHELGHLAAGLMVRMRFILLALGPVMLVRNATGVRLGLNRRADWGVGMAALVPDGAWPQDLVRGRFAVMVAAGPMVSLALAAVCLWAAWPAQTRADGYVALAGLVSGVLALVNLIPFRTGGLSTDGRQLLELARGNGTVADRMDAVAMVAESLAGVRPAHLDPARIARLTGSSEPIMRLGGHQLATAAAFDRGCDPAAHVAVLAREWRAYPPAFQAEIAAIVAVWKARFGADPAGAAAWLEEARKGMDLEGWTALAEVEVAAARGDRAAVATTLPFARDKVARLPDAGMAAFLNDRLDQLAGRA